MCSLSHDLIHDARYWWIMLQLPHALGKAGTYFNVMQHRGSNFSLMHGNLFRKNVRQNGITCHPQRKHLLKPGLPRSRASGKKPACSLSWLLSQVLRHSTRLNIYTAILWRRCRDTELSKAMWVSEDVTTGSITMLAFARLTEQSIWIWLTLILQMSRLQRSGLHLPGQHLILKILSPLTTLPFTTALVTKTLEFASVTWRRRSASWFTACPSILSLVTCHWGTVKGAMGNAGTIISNHIIISYHIYQHVQQRVLSQEPVPYMMIMLWTSWPPTPYTLRWCSNSWSTCQRLADLFPE